MRKQICVLTKSLKDRNYCVAGIELGTGKWIRLVTSKDGNAFPKDLLDDQKVKEFTLIDVAVTKHVPCGVQTENWQIDENEEIIKLGQIYKQKLFEICKLDTPELIFGTANHVLSKNDIKNLYHSLEMIHATSLELDTSLKGDGRHHYKIKFKYNGKEYQLAITDPKFRDEGLDKVKFPSATLIISIPAHPFGENELYYKFVAKVII